MRIINRKNEKKNEILKYTISVVGGGISGVIAATAAAKSGCKTLLIEKSTFLGGVVTMGPLEALMTQYDNERKIIGGIADELIELLKKQDICAGNVTDTTGYCSKIIPYNAEAMKQAILSLLERYHVDYLMETTLVDVIVSEKKIKKIILQTYNQTLEVFSKAYVDCSGSGIMGYYAGCDIMMGDKEGETQPATVLSKWGNVNQKQLRMYVMEHMEEFRTFNENMNLEKEYLHLWGFSNVLRAGYETGELSLLREEMHLMESTVPGHVIVNYSRVNVDPNDSFAMSKAQLEGSRQVSELFCYFRKVIPAFSKAYIIQNSYVGVRESGRIRGRYILTRDDIVEHEKRNDIVAMGAFPMDIHKLGSGMQYERFLRGYGIPANVLWAEGIDNLFMGGRCISSTFEANASVRISMTCMATGHAAGIMAASYEESITESELVRRVQKILYAQNAIIK